MIQTQTVVYLSNAIDEAIKEERTITSDSPAASNKVFALSSAMRGVGIRCIVLSLGRGRQNGTGIKHAAVVKRLEHGAIIYADFWHSPWLTHFVSFASLSWLLVKLIQRHSTLSILAYNRSYHYLPTLLIARLLGAKIYLDLEDGYIVEGRGIIRHLKNRLTRKLFSWLCPHGSIVANSQLAEQLKHPPKMICYGAVASSTWLYRKDWSSRSLQVIFSGTLLEEVGSKLLLTTIDILRCEYPEVVNKIHVVVTGKGPFAESFRGLANEAPEWLSFKDSVRRVDYLNLLKSSHIGLSLRMSSHEMSATTFPSKVIEYAEYGLLVLTTRTSDVPLLFGDTALYLDQETPKDLAFLLSNLSERRDELRSMAVAAQERIIEICSFEAVGQALGSMLTHKKTT
jgi:glycosyltransferase involved in cell wall biosynthesis